MCPSGPASTDPVSAATSKVVFQAQQLDVTLAGRPLLRGVGLTLKQGEITAVIGPSGSGKTTLLRSLALLIEPAGGELRLRGQSAAELGWTCWRRKVVYLAQRPVVLGGSVADNLARPFSFRSAGAVRFALARARQGLAELGLPPRYLDSEARSLSEGERQRVCLLRALLVEPEVLLLDEPTSALDPEAQQRAELMLRAHLEERAGAALMVTHDPAQADRLTPHTLDLRAWVVEHDSSDEEGERADA